MTDYNSDQRGKMVDYQHSILSQGTHSYNIAVLCHWDTVFIGNMLVSASVSFATFFANYRCTAACF